MRFDIVDFAIDFKPNNWDDGPTVMPLFDNLAEMLTLMSTHIASDRVDQPLAYSAFIELERTIAIVAAQFVRITGEWLQSQLSPALIVHQPPIQTSALGSTSMQQGLNNIIGDRWHTLACDSGMGMRHGVDLGQYLYCPYPKIDTFLRAAFRTTMVLAANSSFDPHNALSSVWVYLALPLTMIETLLATRSIDVSSFPGPGQLNCVITTDDSIDGRTFSVEQAEIDNMAAFDARLSLDELYYWVHLDCYKHSAPSFAFAKHTLVPIEYAAAFPTTLSLLDGDGKEQDIVVRAGRIVRETEESRPLRDTWITTVIVPAGSIVRLEQ